MTEEHFNALEGSFRTTPKKYLYFVNSVKEEVCINFLSDYNLIKGRDYKIQKGTANLECFHLNIRNRPDFPELEKVLNENQSLFLRVN